MKEQDNFTKRVTEVHMKTQISATEANTVSLSPSQSNKYYFCMKEGYIHFNCKKYQELIDADKVHINKN